MEENGRLEVVGPVGSGDGLEIEGEGSRMGELGSGGGGFERPRPVHVVEMGGMEPNDSGVAAVEGGCV